MSPAGQGLWCSVLLRPRLKPEAAPFVTFCTAMALAEAIGIDSGVVAKATRLTLLSPKIVHKLILGEADLSMQTLRRSFPLVWEKQESELLK